MGSPGTGAIIAAAVQWPEQIMRKIALPMGTP